MSRFDLQPVPAMSMAAGRIDALGADITALAGGDCRVLLVADPGLAAAGLIDRALIALRASGATVHLFDDLQSDPKESQVGAGVCAADAARADVIVALGGGSALDAAKLIANLTGHDRPARDFRLMANPLPERRARLIAIPTTAGTGSEATATSILSDAAGIKYWYWGPGLRPDLILLDPVLTVGLPPALTAASGVDALVHAVEALTNAKSFAANEATGLTAIRLAAGNLRQAVAEPDNLDARSAMLHAACLAGTAIDNAGTAIAHNIAHALASLTPIHHGRAVAIGMRASLPWNLDAAPARYQAVSSALGLGVPGAFGDWFARLVDDCGIDMKISGLTVDRLTAQMLAPENAPMLDANIRPATADDVHMLAGRVLALA
ncbi:MAG: iron-containing alcohol dehydrogenase [Minwuia sp.]|nr:iron-containing alcohol dehydrogenase [Minwuia sp.]